MRVRWGMAARPVTLINGNTCVIATSFDADYGKQHNVMAIHKDDGRAGHSISDDALCPSCTSFVTNTTINIQLAHLLVP